LDQSGKKTFIFGNFILFFHLKRLHNWGGTFQFATQNIQYPRTVDEVKQIVRRSIKLRVLGCRHSFSKIADSPDTILSTLGMNSILALNTSIPSVTVQSGVTYTDLCPFLRKFNQKI
jgi:alditol oxidase